MNKIYELRNKDRILLEFKVKRVQGLNRTLFVVQHESIIIMERELKYFPLALTGRTIDGHILTNWITNRVKHHGITAYEKSLVQKTKVDYLEVALESGSLSLVDTFWISVKGQELNWSTINPFENPFQQSIANLLLGNTYTQSTTIIGNKELSTPDITLGGTQFKAWTTKKHPYLLKRGDYQSIIEPLATRLNELINIQTLEYKRIKDDSYLVSCEALTDINCSLVTMSDILESQQKSVLIMEVDELFSQIKKYAKTENYLAEIMLTDFLNGNKDRHTNNIHYYINSNNNTEIYGATELLDYGEFFLTEYDLERYEINKKFYPKKIHDEIFKTVTIFRHKLLRDKLTYKEEIDLVKPYYESALKSKNLLKLIIDDLDYGIINNLLVHGKNILAITEIEEKIIRNWIITAIEILKDGSYDISIKNWIEFIHSIKDEQSEQRSKVLLRRKKEC